MKQKPHNPAAGKAWIAARFAIDHCWLGLPELKLSVMKAATRRNRLIAVAIIVVGLMSAISWLNQCRQFRLGLFQAGVEVGFEGYEFGNEPRQGYAKITLRNNTDRKISFPVLRDDENRVAAVISSVRSGAEWTAPAWDETAKDGVFVQRETEAGGAVQLRVPLKAGAAPKRIALLCSGVPEGAIMRWKRTVGSAMARLGVPHGLQILPVDFEQEIWCDQELSLPER